jgi:hypothetical protein
MESILKENIALKARVIELEKLVKEKDALIKEYSENYFWNMFNSISAITGEFHSIINPVPAIISASYMNKPERYEVKVEDVVCVTSEGRTKTILLRKKIVGIGPNERETNKIQSNCKWENIISQLNRVNLNLFKVSKSIAVNVRYYESQKSNINTSENLPKQYLKLETINLDEKTMSNFIAAKANFHRVFNLHKVMIDYKLAHGLPL